MRFNYWQTFYEDSFYHVYNRTVGHEFLFANDGNYRYFLTKWKKYLHPYVDTYGYCLMGNHFHFLIRIKPVTDEQKQIIAAENTSASRRFCTGEITIDAFLEDQFKRFFSAYALSFNKQQKRHGSLFQAKFKRVQIVDDTRLLDTLCYVHHNPIHHDYSPFYDVWQYSSFKAYLSTEPTLIVRKEGLELFDGEGLTAQAFQAYHKAYQTGKRLWKKTIEWEDDMMEEEDVAR
jgi:putative transposase